MIELTKKFGTKKSSMLCMPCDVSLQICSRNGRTRAFILLTVGKTPRHSSVFFVECSAGPQFNGLGRGGGLGLACETALAGQTSAEVEVSGSSMEAQNEMRP